LIAVIAGPAVPGEPTGVVFVTQWGTEGSEPGQFDFPQDVAVAPTGDVYVVDGNDNDRIQRFTSDGAFVSTWGSGGAGPGEFNTPQGVAVDRLGVCTSPIRTTTASRSSPPTARS
jgi:DNA-binding beta-propeller fold protein YncE